MSLEQVCLDLTHRVENHPHNDEHSSAAEKLCGHIGNLQRLGQQLRQDSNDGEENCPGERKT